MFVAEDVDGIFILAFQDYFDLALLIKVNVCKALHDLGSYILP
jgi:hypothetical protein